MHALIVLAHPEVDSFSAALAREAATALAATGWTVDLDDLTREGFHAEAGRGDLRDPPAGLLQIMRAQKRAAAEGGFAPDVAEQIRRLQQADLLVLVFPFWWFSGPALLKGWFDRVLANGIAYGPDPYVDGPLKGTRALACVAVGADADYYGPDGVAGDIHALLNPILHGTLAYCAMDVLEPFLVFGADGRDDTHRTAELDRVRRRLTVVADESPIRTSPLRAQ